jgi:hypothetical protein
MKTHVFKISESVNFTIYDVLFVSIIVFVGILLFIGNNRQSLLLADSINTPLKPDIIKNETMKNPASEIEFQASKNYEHLIRETEPELEAGIANSIIFNDFEMVKLTTSDNSLGTDNFLKDLQVQASKKTNEAIEFFAFEKKTKEYLSIDTEMPLRLENWMVNEKCWCPELRATTALKQEK